MVIDKPTIADFTSSNHDHSNAAGGGALGAVTITGLSTAITSKTADYTLTSTDFTIAFTTGAVNRTVTLPDAIANVGKIYNINKVDIGIGTLIFATTSAQTIGGAASGAIVFYKQNDGIKVQSDGANWKILNIYNAVSFEEVSKNLRGSPYTLNYVSEVLTTMVYTLSTGNTITKTLNYTSGVLTSVVLSGATPYGISLTKTLTYTGTLLTSVAYS